MTDLADRIVSALFDLADTDGGLVKSRAIDRVREVLAGNLRSILPADYSEVRLFAKNFRASDYSVKPSPLLAPTDAETLARDLAAAEALGAYLRGLSRKRP